MEKLYVLDVKGREKPWTFIISGDPIYYEEWLEDGLKISAVVNIIPKWWVDLGLPVRLWCFFQDIFNRIGL